MNNRLLKFVIAGSIVVAGVPLVLLAAREVFVLPPDEAGTVSPLRGGAVALSSPVDATATFPWEQEDPPSLVPLDEIVSGGPDPDGIPPIDHPALETVASSPSWLHPAEPVVAVEIGGDARAYPLQIMMWHEIVNDVVGGEPVSVTYCPLCNTGIVFDRRSGDLVLDFGTSGRLYNSDLVMYDRQTKSLWPQIEGRAVAGELMGTELRVIASSIVSWGEFATAHRGGKVLSRDTGFGRDYGRNPYTGYDTSGPYPAFAEAPDDTRLDPIARVVGIRSGRKAVAYPHDALSARSPNVLADTFAGRDIVVFFRRGTASALDAPEIAQGRDVGATGVFEPRAGNRRLTFEARGGEIVDRETGSRWNLLGHAVSGTLKGARLAPVAHVDTFWFAWVAFLPDTSVRRS